MSRWWWHSTDFLHEMCFQTQNFTLFISLCSAKVNHHQIKSFTQKCKTNLMIQNIHFTILHILKVHVVDKLKPKTEMQMLLVTETCNNSGFEWSSQLHVTVSATANWHSVKGFTMVSKLPFQIFTPKHLCFRPCTVDLKHQSGLWTAEYDWGS